MRGTGTCDMNERKSKDGIASSAVRVPSGISLNYQVSSSCGWQRSMLSAYGDFTSLFRLYPVDKSRVNEFGQRGDHEDDDGQGDVKTTGSRNAKKEPRISKKDD
ncbi:hypothetical protein X801_06723 [Opisthorchis viverrini]|uniref:Uncharacterized protein n=1 Tax=Opisthorchis viverrini TaxID=6198 RepID=A0A1S8WSM3_OPIVI|nr:hypothetical protein X801_06723 [Opisthorchis viverrini]